MKAGRLTPCLVAPLFSEMVSALFHSSIPDASPVVTDFFLRANTFPKLCY